MIYLTGDTHADFTRLSMKSFPEQREMGKKDYLIILGDFGGLWDGSRREEYWLKWLEEKPYTILWVDGNHENYDLLKQFPTSTWHGGRVQRIRSNIIHLKRGQVYTIEGKKFFAFGGARSHDISDGILSLDDPDFRSKYDTLRADPYSMFRIDHLSWWKEEMPSAAECAIGRKNLEKVGWEVDYILSHDCPTFVQGILGKYLPNELNSYFEEIADKTDFTAWYFGHYHKSFEVMRGFTCLYKDIRRLC